MDKKIGAGAQAELYLACGRAVKLFRADAAEGTAKREADIQTRAFVCGIPVPEIYDVTRIDGRQAIVMEFVSGKTLGELALSDAARAPEYMRIAADFQRMLHETAAEGFPSMEDKLRVRIAGAACLGEDQRARLLAGLSDMPFENRVCHGDFHPFNIMQTERGYKIIDWADATGGSPVADACRSYLLLSLVNADFAALYAQTLVETEGISRADMDAWMPFIASARLSENRPDAENRKLIGRIG